MPDYYDSYEQQMGPMLQGMPYMQPTPRPMGPLPRLQFEGAGPGFTPSFSSFGGMATPMQIAWNAFLNPNSPMSPLGGRMANYGMVQGPSSGSAMAYATFRRQQSDIARIREMTNQFDMQRINRVVSGGLEIMNPTITAGMTKAQIERQRADREALARTYSGAYASIVQNPMAQMLGLEDYLVPGGLSSSFSSRMYLAGTRARPPSGKFGMSPEDVAGITEQLASQAAPGGKVNLGFTRGFSMRQMGEVAIGMTERGAMKFGGDKGTIVKQVKEMVGALDAMKDLMGSPDAPINELMQSLDDMFGGNAIRTIPAARLEGMVTTAQAMGRQMNLTGDTIQTLFREGAMQARGYGLYGQLGAMAMAPALEYAEGGRNLMENSGPGRTRIGALSIEDRLRTLQTMSLQTTGSKFTNNLGASMYMREITGGKFGDTKMRAALDKVAAGQSLSSQEYAMLNEQTRGSNLLQHAAGAGISERAYYDITRNTELTQDQVLKYGLQKHAIPAMGNAFEKKLTRLMSGRSDLAAFGIGNEKQAAAFVQHMMASTSVTDEGIQEHMAKFGGLRNMDKGKLGQLYASLRMDAKRASAGVVDANGRPLELESAIENWGAAGAGYRSRNRADVALSAAMDQSFRRAGIGRGPGGGAGLLQGFLQQVASVKEGEPVDIEKMALGTFGGVMGSDLSKALQRGPAAKALKDLREEYQKIAKLSKEIEETEKSTGKDREERLKSLNDQRKAATDRLAGAGNALGIYADLIDPERAQAVDNAKMAAFKTDNLRRYGTELDKRNSLLSFVGEMDAGTIDDAKQFGGRDSARFEKMAKRRNELKGLWEKAVAPGSSEQDVETFLVEKQKFETDRAEELTGMREAVKRGVIDGNKESTKDQDAKNASSVDGGKASTSGYKGNGRGGPASRSDIDFVDGNNGIKTATGTFKLDSEFTGQHRGGVPWAPQ